MNTYIFYKVNGVRYVLHTDLTRTDGHFRSDEPEPLPEDDYCHGCETGAESVHAHTEACNHERGFT
jgi:hypothetical protein